MVHANPAGSDDDNKYENVVAYSISN